MRVNQKFSTLTARIPAEKLIAIFAVPRASIIPPRTIPICALLRQRTIWAFRGEALATGRVLGDVLSAEAPREAGSHYRQAADIAEELGMRPEIELVAAGLAKIKGRARRMG